MNLDPDELGELLDQLPEAMEDAPPWRHYLDYLGGRRGDGRSLPLGVKRRLRAERHYIPAHATIYASFPSLLRKLSVGEAERARILARLGTSRSVFLVRTFEVAFFNADYVAIRKTYGVPKLDEQVWGDFRAVIAAAHGLRRVIFLREHTVEDAARRVVAALGVSKEVSERLRDDTGIVGVIQYPMLSQPLFDRHDLDVVVWTKGDL